MIQMLKKKDLPSKEVFAAMAEIGIGSRTVEKVKKEIHIKAYRSGNCWYWTLPDKKQIKKDR